MTVYLDILFVTNMWIDYFLLLLTATLAKTAARRLRILLAAVFGGLYCVFAFTVFLPPFAHFLGKGLSGILIAFLAFGYKSGKQFVRCTVMFFIVSFLFGGLLYGIYFLFQPKLLFFQNATPYIRLSPVLMIVCSATVYLLLTLFKSLTKPQSVDVNDIYNVDITYRGKTISTTGFVDTGNELTDLFTDTPVILCDYNLVLPLLSEEEKPFFENFSQNTNRQTLPNRIRLIPANTVAGHTLLPAFSPDRLEIKNRQTQCIDRVFIAVFPASQRHNEHPVVLHPQLITSEKRG